MNPLLEQLQDPVALERLFHEDAAQFRIWLDEAEAARPEAETLRVWRARLDYEAAAPEPADGADRLRALGKVAVLSLLAFAAVRLPALLEVDPEWFYPRFAPLIVVGALIAYYFPALATARLRWVVIGTYAGLLGWMCLLPVDESDTLVMSLLYAPFVALSLLGLAFGAGQWRSVDVRIRFVRFLGEALIHTTLIVIGGVVLSALTMGLFRLIGLNIEEWYLENVVVWGLVSAPIVATYLFEVVLRRTSSLAPLLSNVFSPLFLVMVVLYLVALLTQGRNPVADREFLIQFNGLLLVVWGITVFSVCGGTVRHKLSRLMDLVNITLVVVTLAINAIALAAIVIRFMQFGPTPNRVAVTGANVLIFGHLLLMLGRYVKTGKSGEPARELAPVIARYLPAYTAWSLFVVVVLPVLFGFA